MFLFFLLILVLILATCQKKPEQPTSQPQPNAPAANFTSPSQGKLQLMAYTAVKSGSGYKAVFKLLNLEPAITTATITVKLYYARNVIAEQQMLVVLNPGEKKQFELQFNNVPTAQAVAVESPNLINPAYGR